MFMTPPIVLRRVWLTDKHRTTGNTRHYRDGTLVPAPAELRIVQHFGDTAFYLYYCDSSGREMTDTWHESLARAMAQAEWEFEVTPEDWETVTGS
jgi:hypothetical protein